MTGRPLARGAADAVLEALSNGFTLLEICSRPGMPSRSAVYGLIDADVDDFAKSYEVALQRGGDAVADLAHVLAASTTKDNATANKVVLDQLRWRASRLNARYAAPVSADTAADDIPSVDLEGARNRLLSRFTEVAARFEAHERDRFFLTQLVSNAAHEVEAQRRLDPLEEADRAAILEAVRRAIAPPDRSQNSEPDVAEHNSVNGIGDVPSQNSEPHVGCAVPLDIEPLVSSIPAATVEVPAVPYPWDAWMRR
jgi:hypothetical protein